MVDKILKSQTFQSKVDAKLYRQTIKSLYNNTTADIQSKKPNRKILLLSDSQGRQCSEKLKAILTRNDNVMSYVYPGAKMKTVVNNVSLLTKDFTLDDFVVIQSGTNDVDPECPYQLTLASAINSIMKLNNKTNVIIYSIPIRYDIDNSQDLRTANMFIKSYLDKLHLKTIHFVDSWSLLSRDMMTRHGLHLNVRGKSVIVDDIKRQITFWDTIQRLSNRTMSSNQHFLSTISTNLIFS